MSPLAKFQPVPHPQNLGILNTGFNRKARNAPRCQSCSKHPCFTLQFCASSPDACTHTHTSHQAIKASRVPRVHKQLKSHWVAQLWQSEKEPSIPTQSPSLQAPQGVLAAPISHPRGDAPGSAAGKDLFMFENVKLL